MPRMSQNQMKLFHPDHAIPQLPVLGWATFKGHRRPKTPSRFDSPDRVYTTSGRAAIGLALRILDVGRGDRILVPSYHCPTMISPVTRLGAVPRFFPVTATGAPDIEFLERQDVTGVRALLAVHYFGLPQPMSQVRAFCDARGIALIEDCAHAYFGTSEGRTVGGWGDLAIASLTKFFPVPEGGCLVSNARALDGNVLEPRRVIAELRAFFDSVEMGARHHRFPGLNSILHALFGAKEVVRGRGRMNATPEGKEIDATSTGEAFSDELLRSRLTYASRKIADRAHRSRIVELRRRNYQLLATLLADVPGAAPLSVELPESAVPYVFPLRVERPVERYRALRAEKVPLFRWDQIWPGTPTLEGDHGCAWSTEMFQLGCHQDLTEDAIREIATTVRRVFAAFA